MGLASEAEALVILREKYPDSPEQERFSPGEEEKIVGEEGGENEAESKGFQTRRNSRDGFFNAEQVSH